MLFPFKELLEKKKIILGSSSKNRKNILDQIGLNFEIFPSTFEENLDKSKYENAQGYVKDTCQHKFWDIQKKFAEQKKEWDILICADTIVVQNNKILEKPQDYDECYSMIKSYSNNKIQVFTHVCLAYKFNNGNTIEEKSFCEESFIFFDDLPEIVITNYCKSDYPWGKAGAIGIQDMGSTLIKRIEGCYYNVVGLPIYSLCKQLYQLMDKDQ